MRRRARSSTAEVVEAAARALSRDADRHARRGPAPRPPRVAAARASGTCRDAGSQTSLAVLFRAVPELDPRYVALVALLRVLDDGMSTRLHYTLADQKGLAYSIHAAIEPLADTALFEITGATANAKVPALVRELLALLDGLRDGQVTDDELAKARVRYRYETLASIDDAVRDGRLVRRHRALLPAADALGAARADDARSASTTSSTSRARCSRRITSCCPPSARCHARGSASSSRSSTTGVRASA